MSLNNSISDSLQLKHITQHEGNDDDVDHVDLTCVCRLVVYLCLS